MVTLLKTTHERTQARARDLLASIDTGDVDEAYTQAFAALTHEAEVMAQEKEDAEKGENADTARISRRGIIEHLVNDYSAGYIIKLVKETDYYIEGEENDF